MKAGLGFDYLTPATTSSAKERNCSYGSPDGIAAVHFIILAGLADFEPLKVGMSAGGQKVDDISGLGDQAFSSVLSLPGGKAQSTIGARKGTFAVIVTSRASLDKEKALVAQLLG